MKRFLTVRLIWFLDISGFLFNTCKKQEPFDLFPLKANNEFYYKYEHRISFGAVDDLTKEKALNSLFRKIINVSF